MITMAGLFQLLSRLPDVETLLGPYPFRVHLPVEGNDQLLALLSKFCDSCSLCKSWECSDFCEAASTRCQGCFQRLVCKEARMLSEPCLEEPVTLLSAAGAEG